MHVLHWLVNQGYNYRLTDMSASVKGSLLTYQGLPPMERMSLEDAGTWSPILGLARSTIVYMCVELCCQHVILLFLGRSEHHLTYWALFFRNLVQL